MTSLKINSQLNKSDPYRNLSFREFSTPPKPLTARENLSPDSTRISERHIQCIWSDNRLRPANLVSSDGDPVQIIDPGRWNLEAGPDFLDAVISTGTNQTIRRGDIEIHLEPSAWVGHGHHENPAYSKVIAHVCYKPGTIKGVLPPGTVQIDLGQAIRNTPGLFPEDVDTTAYPCALDVRSASECRRYFSALNPEHQSLILKSAGYERLRLKSHRMARLLQHTPPEQVLYGEIMAALGYKHNSTPFRILASATPLKDPAMPSDGDAVAAYAILLGTAGLLPRDVDRKAAPEVSEFVRLLWDHWWKQESTFAQRIKEPVKWNLSSVRPQNHPVRRLALAACLFHSSESLPDKLSSLMESNNVSIQSLTNLLSPSTKIPYWEKRLSLTGRKQKQSAAMLGKDRIASILINILIPFLNAKGYDITGLIEELPPENFNTITRTMLSFMTGPDSNSALYRHALVQQGLIQIFSDFCLDKHNSCTTCPFANALTPSP